MDIQDACRLISYFFEAVLALGPAYLLGLIAWRISK